MQENSTAEAPPHWPDNGSPFGNQWFGDLRQFMDRLREFDWTKNPRFKYVNIRVDTRNGRFVLYDIRDDGMIQGRISPADVVGPYDATRAAIQKESGDAGK